MLSSPNIELNSKNQCEHVPPNSDSRSNYDTDDHDEDESDSEILKPKVVVESKGRSKLPPSNTACENDFIHELFPNQATEKKNVFIPDTDELKKLKSQRNFTCSLDALDEKWYSQFELLVHYGNRFGTCNISSTLICILEDKSEIALGKWVAKQRYDNKKGIIRPDRYSTLQILVDEKKFDWIVEKAKESSHFQLDNDGWDRWYELLLKYGAEHGGNCNVTWSYCTTAEDGSTAKLGKWLAYQRSKFRTKELNPLRVEKLQQLVDAGRLDWEVKERHKLEKDAKWEERFNLMLKFGESRNGNCNVPASFITKGANGKDILLGVWLCNQRQNKKYGELRPDREKRLQALADEGRLHWFLDSPPQSTKCLSNENHWLLRYEAILKYGNEHGDNYNVPWSYECELSNGTSTTLGQWLAWQRVLHDRGRLMSRRFQLLDELRGRGKFSWAVEGQDWQGCSRDHNSSSSNSRPVEQTSGHTSESSSAPSSPSLSDQRMESTSIDILTHQNHMSSSSTDKLLDRNLISQVTSSEKHHHLLNNTIVVKQEVRENCDRSPYLSLEPAPTNHDRGLMNPLPLNTSVMRGPISSAREAYNFSQQNIIRNKSASQHHQIHESIADNNRTGLPITPSASSSCFSGDTWDDPLGQNMSTQRHHRVNKATDINPYALRLADNCSGAEPRINTHPTPVSQPMKLQNMNKTKRPITNGAAFDLASQELVRCNQGPLGSVSGSNVVAQLPPSLYQHRQQHSQLQQQQKLPQHKQHQQHQHPQLQQQQQHPQLQQQQHQHPQLQQQQHQHPQLQQQWEQQMRQQERHQLHRGDPVDERFPSLKRSSSEAGVSFGSDIDAANCKKMKQAVCNFEELLEAERRDISDLAHRFHNLEPNLWPDVSETKLWLSRLMGDTTAKSRISWIRDHFFGDCL